MYPQGPQILILHYKVQTQRLRWEESKDEKKSYCFWSIDRWQGEGLGVPFNYQMDKW